MTPEGVVNTRHVNRQHTQCDAEQVKGQEAPVILLASTGKRVVHGREDHAYLRQSYLFICLIARQVLHISRGRRGVLPENKEVTETRSICR